MGVIILWAVMLGALYLFLLRPQQARARAQREMLNALEVGDEVLTAAGIYGTIAEFDGGTVFLAVSDNLEIKVTKESISERVVYAEADAEAD
ncbi:MAG: preprotein translocase subunit YajC [Actinomycetota bacterium]